MPKGDDILLGASIAPKTDTDSDGDGVSDAQERLDGTDPGDAADHLTRDPILKPDAIDPRGDLERVNLEREVGFDPTANMPEGMSVDSGLAGLTNVDGSALSTGTNRHGIGEDSILDGRVGANSPLDMLKDAAGGGGDGPKGSGGLPGADLGSRGPKWDLVGGEAETASDEFELPGAIKPAITPPPPMPDPPPPPPDAEREPPPPPVPDADPKPDLEPGPVPLQTDPDAGGNSGVNVAGGGVPIIIDGPRFVEGHGGGPKIEGDQPQVRYRDLVTDPGDEGGGINIATGDAPRGAPDAPVVRPINPNSGVVQPPTGGPPPSGGGGGGDDLYGSSSAATAASADVTGAPSISVVGGGGGSGIGSVAPAAEQQQQQQTPDLVAGLRDPSIRPAGNVGAQHGAPDPVDRFASEYLKDASLDAPDFVSTGLAADLGADLVPVADEGVRRHDDPDVDAPDGFAGLDGADPLEP